MNINLLTDAPRHNLALMKLSAWHKNQGHDVALNMPILPAKFRYASILFEHNINLFISDISGGPAFNGSVLIDEVEQMKPDYDLFNLDYSLGYTFRPCFNSCGFCKVPKMNHPDTKHHSIWEFHDSKFKKICLLNNNTFQDLEWLETFKEVWDADLSVIDENGYDLRLLDDEKADALKKTKWEKGKLGLAWDQMKDEGSILSGLEIAKRHNLLTHNTNIYVLIGYNTKESEDIYRCQKIIDFGANPYPMPFVKNRYTKRFKRFVNLHYYRKYKTIKEAWKDYLR